MERIRRLVFVFVAVFHGCVDPIPPEFQFKEGLVFIDGFASSLPGSSFVTINETAVEFGVRVVKFIEGATVSFENDQTGEEILLTEAGESYIVDADFAIEVGETWKLKVSLANGKRYESDPEVVLSPVPLDDLRIAYDPELVFREVNGGRFVPGHQVSVTFNDPEEEENFYYWTYRTFENLDYCAKCFEGLYRDGDCISFNLGRPGRYFDYICDTPCWRIRFPEGIAIFDDQFSNGNQILNLPIGNVLLYTKENMVVEVQQFSLTPAAHAYYKVLKDIVDNSAGLNAPPPAALIGNLFNPSDGEEVVLGRFTAAASASASIFVERKAISEPPLENRDAIVLEPLVGSPYPPPATNFAPCQETKTRTAIAPLGWQDF
jgi:hypothetical protein